jgi:hypothetical protein
MDNHAFAYFFGVPGEAGRAYWQMDDGRSGSFVTVTFGEVRRILRSMGATSVEVRRGT